MLSDSVVRCPGFFLNIFPVSVKNFQKCSETSASDSSKAFYRPSV